jgi:hypothetical protein
MLAMDVVDTIRHRELLVERELGQGERDTALRERLREIYKSQGIEVTDAIIDQGIKALRESRFVYTPPPPGFGRSLAMLWVYRGRIFGLILAIFLTATAAWAGWRYGVELPRERAVEAARVELSEDLPKSLQLAYDDALRESKVDAARARADELFTDGRSALGRKDATATRTAIEGLNALRARLAQTYQLRIVQGESNSGFWRIPEANPDARNYYLVVEAIAPNGQALSMPIKNEETGRTETVSKWGVRVSEDVFETVRSDATDDGIIQDRDMGQKRRGELEPEYSVPVEGMLTRWDD